VPWPDDTLLCFLARGAVIQARLLDQPSAARAVLHLKVMRRRFPSRPEVLRSFKACRIKRTIPGLLPSGRPEFAISGMRSAVPSKVTRVWLRSPLAASWLPALVTIPSPRGWFSCSSPTASAPASAGCGDRRSDRRRRAGEKYATTHSHVRPPRVPHTPTGRLSPAVPLATRFLREEAPIADYGRPSAAN